MNDAFFQRVSLTSLGLVIQLGHKYTEKCTSAMWVDPFTVLDLNGFQPVIMEFCSCEASNPHHIQLLWYGWYPVSITRPQTASTMSLLKFYHNLTLESKTNMNEFHNTLTHLTDNTGTSPKIVRIAFLSVCKIVLAIFRITPRVCAAWLDNTATSNLSNMLQEAINKEAHPWQNQGNVQSCALPVSNRVWIWCLDGSWFHQREGVRLLSLSWIYH